MNAYRNLKEMEDAARKRQEEEVAAGVLEAKAKAAAEAEERRKLELQAIAFLAEKTRAGPKELECVVSVLNWDRPRCLVTISLPEHTTIRTYLRRGENEVMRWGDDDRRRWQIYNPSRDNFRYCRYMSDALAIAARLYAEAEEAEEKEMERQDLQEAQQKERRLDQIERGLRYVGIFEDHPFLEPIFDLLVAYVEDKEIFEADLDAAEEFTASMDAQYAQRLHEARMSQAVADDARHQLQHDLWNEQGERRRAEEEARKCRKR